MYACCLCLKNDLSEHDFQEHGRICSTCRAGGMCSSCAREYCVNFSCVEKCPYCRATQWCVPEVKRPNVRHRSRSVMSDIFREDNGARFLTAFIVADMLHARADVAPQNAAVSGKIVRIFNIFVFISLSLSLFHLLVMTSYLLKHTVFASTSQFLGMVFLTSEITGAGYGTWRVTCSVDTLFKFSVHFQWSNIMKVWSRKALQDVLAMHLAYISVHAYLTYMFCISYPQTPVRKLHNRPGTTLLLIILTACMARFIQYHFVQRVQQYEQKALLVLTRVYEISQ